MSDEDVSKGALEFVKKNKKELLERFASAQIHKPVDQPISLFMAGSPGAGKTEVSKSLIRKFESIPIRIDADEIRCLCPGYDGANAHLYQEAANKGVNILYDHALEKEVNCILDGTFAYAAAANNIDRSLRRDRIVEIWFIYQDFKRAWDFTKIRELTESRHVSREVFISSLLAARDNVKAVKKQFGRSIELNLMVKDYESGTEDFYLNVAAEALDRYIGDQYTKESLERILI